ncbi:hypothetical protein ROJ8625_02388 [Roseivivax jejudonensis]|uniref:Uncharacterized protein n=1 Tax=Roseivivax jejudonensis TaxID=1529041 RepID=A0A1X6ZEG5_9RHOB|nr:hypothetical protein [Roseivivax jejudonensis]SLN48830.1 hypothetical protein ROJ8625_02388 [Roseivivax jejudonensis]
MKLFLYRLSLTDQYAGGLFEGVYEPEISREEFLRRRLSSSFGFDYRKGIRLRYEFIQEDRGIIAAALCRWIPETAENDPADPFAQSEGGRWKRAAVFCNISDDQQVVGLEDVNGVGTPDSILGGLVETINAFTLGEPYRIDAEALPRSGSFREAVSGFPGPITSIKFDLVVPNPPDAEKETREALKRLREETGMERRKEELSSEHGLNVDSEYINGFVQYSEEGGGNIVAKSASEEVYNSNKMVRYATISDELRPTGSPIKNLFNALIEILMK